MQQPQSLVQNLHFSAATRPPNPFFVSSCLIQCSSSRTVLHSSREIPRQQQQPRRRWEIFRRIRLNRSIVAAAAATEWMFEPAGDGDWSHIGEKVAMPSAFELSSEAATVGRVEGKADIVVAIGTVSGIHARLEKKEAVLLVTDLDSTNGTYVDNRRLRPGAVTPVLPGSSITFGDEHLAKFKFLLKKNELL